MSFIRRPSRQVTRPPGTMFDRGELTVRLIRFLAPLYWPRDCCRRAAGTPIDAVSVRGGAPAIDLTAVLDHQRGDGDRIQVSTRLAPTASSAASSPRPPAGRDWSGVFALANNTDDQLDRPKSSHPTSIVSSGLLWRSPDCRHRHPHAVDRRPSRPRRSATADIFRITLDPGAVITFVSRVRTDKLPQKPHLWE